VRTLGLLLKHSPTPRKCWKEKRYASFAKTGKERRFGQKRHTGDGSKSSGWLTRWLKPMRIMGSRNNKKGLGSGFLCASVSPWLKKGCAELVSNDSEMSAAVGNNGNNGSVTGNPMKPLLNGTLKSEMKKREK